MFIDQPNAAMSAIETFIILGALLVGSVYFFILVVRKTAAMDADHCCMCGGRELYYKNKAGCFFCLQCVAKYSLAWEQDFYKLVVPVLVKPRKVRSKAALHDEYPAIAVLGKHSRPKRVLAIHGLRKR